MHAPTFRRMASLFCCAFPTKPAPSPQTPPPKAMVDKSSIKVHKVDAMLGNHLSEYYRILDHAGISYYIIGRHAFAHYEGWPRCFDDLELVVADPEAAGEFLRAAGYMHRPYSPGTVQGAAPEMRHRYGPLPCDCAIIDAEWKRDPSYRQDREDRRFNRPGGSLHVVLYPANSWGVEVPQTAGEVLTRYPTVPQLLDRYMNELLKINISRGYRLHLQGLLFDMYYEKDHEPNTLAYAAQLSPENRQLHLDIVSGVAKRDVCSQPWTLHYRDVREDIRQGQLEPLAPSNSNLYVDIRKELRRRNEEWRYRNCFSDEQAVCANSQSGVGGVNKGL